MLMACAAAAYAGKESVVRLDVEVEKADALVDMVDMSLEE
jgi:hypothetical protein